MRRLSLVTTPPETQAAGTGVDGLPEDISLMDELIRSYYRELLKSVKENVKMGDFIKMIEFRRKLAPAESEQKKFWAMLDKVRKEVLVGNGKGRAAIAAVKESRD